MAIPQRTRDWTLTHVQNSLDLFDSPWEEFRKFALELLHTNGLPNAKPLKEEISRLDLITTLYQNLPNRPNLPVDASSHKALYQCLRLLGKNQKAIALRPKASHTRAFPLASQPLQKDLKPPPNTKSVTKLTKSNRKRPRENSSPLARDIFAQSLRSVQLHKQPAQSLPFSQRKKRSARTADLYILETTSDLKKYLEGPMDLPAMISPSSPAMRQILQNDPSISIVGLLSSYPPDSVLQAQYLDKEFNQHEEITVGNALKDMTESPSTSRDCWNVLDFGHIGASRTPSEIRRVDACRLADDAYKKAHTHVLSRPEQKSYLSHVPPKGSESDPIPWKQISDWWLLSCRGTSSPVHVDSGGLHTFIRTEEGSKVWTYLPHPSEEDRKIIEVHGFSEADRFSRPIVQIELEQNSLFLMPAGTPHHVFTPTNCLASGGFFLTKRTFADTLRAAEIGDRCGDCTNDEPPPQMHRYYSFLLDWYRSASREDLLASGCGSRELGRVIQALTDYTHVGAKKDNRSKRKRTFRQTSANDTCLKELRARLERW